MVIAVPAAAQDLVNYWSFNGNLLDTAGNYAQNVGGNATNMTRFGSGEPLYGPGRTAGTYAVRTRYNGETYQTIVDPNAVNPDAKFFPSYTVSYWTKTQAWGRSGWAYAMLDGPRFSTILFQYNSNGSMYIPSGPYTFSQTDQRKWKDRSANGTSASVGLAGRIMRSNRRGWLGRMRPDRGGAAELSIHAQGRIFVVGADRP